ncbi:MAG TPA: hypothetical protein VEA41_05040 [Salinarimonas sp.]|nr:hypothetical protein [Salinarimonas sp.]
MIPINVAGPAVEPASPADLASTLRAEPVEEALIASLVRAARLLVEAQARLVLIEQTWRLVLDRWPRDRIVRLPLWPVIAVDLVRVHDGAGFATLPPAHAALDGASDPARLLVGPAAPDPGRPVGGIEITLRAGFGPSPADVPEPLIQAIRLLVGRWFEHRGDALHDTALPADVAALIAPHRRLRLA